MLTDWRTKMESNLERAHRRANRAPLWLCVLRVVALLVPLALAALVEVSR